MSTNALPYKYITAPTASKRGLVISLLIAFILCSVLSVPFVMMWQKQKDNPGIGVLYAVTELSDESVELTSVPVTTAAVNYYDHKKTLKRSFFIEGSGFELKQGAYCYFYFKEDNSLGAHLTENEEEAIALAQGLPGHPEAVSGVDFYSWVKNPLLYNQRWLDQQTK